MRGCVSAAVNSDTNCFVLVNIPCNMFRKKVAHDGAALTAYTDAYTWGETLSLTSLDIIEDLPSPSGGMKASKMAPEIK